jgi:hypothetical protein
MELFIKYNIPSDLLAFGGKPFLPSTCKIGEVKRHVEEMNDMVEETKVRMWGIRLGFGFGFGLGFGFDLICFLFFFELIFGFSFGSDSFGFGFFFFFPSCCVVLLFLLLDSFYFRLTVRSVN